MTTTDAEPWSACEWAETIGEGIHVDMGGPHDAELPHRYIATCCEIGEIDGPEGSPVMQPQEKQ